MKVPLKWLAEYVPLTLPVAELVERLTLAGLEVSERAPDRRARPRRTARQVRGGRPRLGRRTRSSSRACGKSIRIPIPPSSI